MQEELTLPRTAAQLGVAYTVAFRLALTGAFGRIRQVNGRWRIPAAGVEAYAAARSAPAAKPEQ